MERRLVVADIHGHYSTLIGVLEKAGYNPDKDRLFLLGDYIDRGDASGATLKYVRSLVENGAVALRGNHEQMMLDAVKDPGQLTLWLYNRGDMTLKNFGGYIPDWAIGFVESLPLYHEEPDYILVHAGLRPNVPLEQQTPRDLLWIREPFFNEYTGKPVVFGHTPTKLLHGKWEPWFGDSKIGIDTGIAYGGVLTLMDLDTKETWVI